jgi:hypothetical protein
MKIVKSKISVILLFFATLASFSVKAQSNIADQFSPSIKSLYSKSITLFQNSSYNDLVINGGTYTILFQDNDFYNGLTSNEIELLFTQLNKAAIDNFFASYLVEKKYDYISLLTQINNDGGKTTINNKRGESMQFSKHMNTIMIFNPNKFELNVVGNVAYNNSIFYFL